MKVYTYYEEIEGKSRSDSDRDLQRILLDTWISTWKQNGFEPVVLGKEDAQSHPMHKKYIDSIISAHKEANDSDLHEHPYWIVAHNEWIAFANSVEGRALVCDYDVLNISYTPEMASALPNKFVWLDGLCSCMAKGTKEEYLSFCELIISEKEYLISEMKAHKELWGRTEFGDQDYLQFLEGKFKKSRLGLIFPQTRVSLYDHEGKTHEGQHLVHFAHDTIYRARNDPAFEGMSIEQIRLKCVHDVVG